MGKRRTPLRGAHTEGPPPGGPDRLSFAHLAALTDEHGLFEHALYREPRFEHGYCADDAGRALAVVCREPEWDVRLEGLAEVYLRYLEQAQRPDGRFRNRRSAGPGGVWDDAPGSDDAQGRALFGLAVAAASGHPVADRAFACFGRGADVWESPSSRPNAWVALAAAEVGSKELLEQVRPLLARARPDPAWPWPEPRLAYDNALLPDALIAAGEVDEGVELLAWLAGVETLDGHFSFAPAGGWGPGEPRPGFDQQPVEAGTTAAACARGFAVTGDPRFRELTLRAEAWFLGVNDTGVALLDPATGACCDGLQREGRNENCGAESTLAALQAARSARSSSSVETVAAPTARSAAP
jgi:hypothetical protein